MTAAKELFYKKRWLVIRYNLEHHLMHGDRALQTPNMQKWAGGLTTRLLHHRGHMNGSAADKPYWVRTFLLGSKRPNYNMTNVGDGGSRSWNHSWQRYRVSDAQGHEQFLDLRGPEPR
eukprot:TRINITY_DN11094_c0_g1_i2.p3 TRINITY_DN11094_c0_g1~~TRINITY_DN11094_c0_g1_i2.p3  ORF type:complete len:125 (+),score=21.05 TRINITY_DN11094_c0_g1_i2:24-377(+)